jgi:hypothetical protein
MAGQTIFLEFSRAKSLKVFTHKKSGQNRQNLGFAGQIISFRWPRLARLPYVGHV